MSPREHVPPFDITPKIVNLVAEIAELVGRLTYLREQPLRLRRIQQVRTIRGSLAIEGNTLSEEQITAILEGRPVIAPAREVQEVRNAIDAYERLAEWDPRSEEHLLEAHAALMKGLIDELGCYRRGGVGVLAGERVLHMAPPAGRVPELMADLFGWLGRSPEHPLITSSVFHYEFEFIHPFADGNGRMGRLWQTLLLGRWNPVLSELPIESLVHARQPEYYAAIEASTQAGDSAAFIQFMLECVLQAVCESTPQATPQAAPQAVELVRALEGERTREELQQALGLSDRKSFRERYLEPALQGGLIELTIPDKPRSPNQRYRLTEAGERLRRQS